jgi:hypothetical protein
MRFYPFGDLIAPSVFELHIQLIIQLNKLKLDFLNVPEVGQRNMGHAVSVHVKCDQVTSYHRSHIQQT